MSKVKGKRKKAWTAEELHIVAEAMRENPRAKYRELAEVLEGVLDRTAPAIINAAHRLRNGKEKSVKVKPPTEENMKATQRIKQRITALEKCVDFTREALDDIIKVFDDICNEMEQIKRDLAEDGFEVEAVEDLLDRITTYKAKSYQVDRKTGMVMGVKKEA